jgi:hypothetical protein
MRRCIIHLPREAFNALGIGAGAEEADDMTCASFMFPRPCRASIGNQSTPWEKVRGPARGLDGVLCDEVGLTGGVAVFDVEGAVFEPNHSNTAIRADVCACIGL